ncbi:ryanodine-inositol 1,4,5-triphosphate receptor Ca2 channel (RIR-CaC) family protein [Achlya hypogyna]|uniref:Ryanodine-inositol 1,4,5-triphosphate receptor Ca2 channel (RIR-CaC) family protein n=1 Tax=Achlya hypogyna TaxID=1202772 RepID=A0A1V9ZUM9_ACHHY|nr:ryanodine-inositol 1,4,5-triphosphate receptor Ca2 channel (RIR-CaC) family protein [Achlya hypogyna]
MDRRKSDQRRRQFLTVDTALAGNPMGTPMPTRTLEQVKGTRLTLTNTDLRDGGNEYLEYGMIVALMSTDRNGVLASEGFTTFDVRLEHLVPDAKDNIKARSGQLVACHYKDCLFEIVPKMSYEATACFDQAKATTKASSEGFSTAFSELKFKSESEQRLNANSYTKLLGKRVTYGQTIQLRHVKSAKFMCGREGVTPSIDAAEIHLGHGSSDAHFALFPRYKLRKFGEPVHRLDQFFLTTEAKQLHVHASSRLASDGVSALVVGSKSHSSSWRVVPFERQAPATNGLQAGNCVRLLHLETNAWLGCYNGSCHVRIQSDPRDGLDASPVISSNTLWEVERAFVCDGGAIHWSDAISLRHVTTGKYLTMDAIATTIVLDPTPQPFNFQPTTSVHPQADVPKDAVVLLQHAACKRFVHATDAATTRPFADGDVHEYEVGALPASHDDDAFRLVPVTTADTTDTLLLVSYRRILVRFVEFFSPEPAPPAASLLDQMEAALVALRDFAFASGHDVRRPLLLRRNHYVELLTAVLKAPFAAYGGPFPLEYVCAFNYASHTLFDRMQSNVSPTLDGLDDEDEDGDGGADRAASQAAVLAALPTKHQLSDTAMQSLNRILCAVNLLLYRIFTGVTGVPDDAAACRDAMPVLMQLLGHGFKASVPLSFLIQEKWHDSESLVSYSRTLQSFVDLIATRGKSIRYLQFLVVLCSANGRAVGKIQEKLGDLLFATPTLVVPTRPSAHGLEINIPTRARGDRWVLVRDFYAEYYDTKQHTILGPYYYGLLQLYVALCAERNYASIERLRPSFPRTALLFTVQDSGVSRSVRAVLLQLLLALYIDVEPHKVVASPLYTRVWNDALRGIPSVTRDGDDGRFLAELKAFLLAYMAKHAGIIVVAEYPQNELTLAVVRCVHKLVAFGLFSDNLVALVPRLVDLLDSRTDIVEARRTGSTSSYVVPFFETSVHRQRNPVYRQYSNNEAEVVPMLGPNGVSTGEAAISWQAANKQARHGLHRLSALTTKSSSASLRRLPDTKYTMSEWNKVVMDIKDSICAALLVVDSFRLDYQLSTVLFSLRSKGPKAPGWSSAKRSSPLTAAMQNSSLECAYSLHVLAGRRVDTVLLQALLYEHPPLVCKALELYMQQFNEHDQLLKALGSALLLVNDNAVTAYSRLEAHVDDLRRLAETTEVWMDLTSKADFAAAAQAAHSLRAVLVEFLPNERRPQTLRMLRNLRGAAIVLTMVDAGSHIFHTLFPSQVLGRQSANPTLQHCASETLVDELATEKQREALHEVYKLSMELLARMSEDADGATDVADHAETLMAFVEVLPTAQTVLACLFASETRADTLAIEDIGLFVRLAAHYKSTDARFLDLLTAIAVTPRMQKTILAQLGKHMAIVDFSSGLVKSHAGALNLLARCADGPEMREWCAASFVPLASWIDVFEATDDWSLALACLRYFREVFVQVDDCLESVDPTFHCRILRCVARVAIKCMRLDLLALQQVDLQLTAPTPTRHTLEALLNVIVPMLDAYLPKAAGSVVLPSADWEEWLAAWYVWLFGTWQPSNGRPDEVQNVVRYIDTLWHQEALGDLWYDIAARPQRPLLDAGLAGLRANEAFVFDLDSAPFTELLVEAKGYHAHLKSLPRLSSIVRPRRLSCSQSPRLSMPHETVLATDSAEQLLPSSMEPKSSWIAKVKNKYWWEMESIEGSMSVRTLSPKVSAYRMPRASDGTDDDGTIVTDFVHYARNHSRTKLLMRDELSRMMHNILSVQNLLREEHLHTPSVPLISLTFDDIVAKLVGHFKLLKTPKFTKMSLTLLEVLIQLITSLESPESRHAMQIKLDGLGVTDLVVDLVGSAEDPSVFDKAITLGIALLDGMNAKVQEHFHAIWLESANAVFFQRLVNRLATPQSISSVQPPSPVKHATKSRPEGTGKHDSITRVFRFLQLLCEGHYLDTQRYLLQQSTSTYNLVEAAVGYLLDLPLAVTTETAGVLKQIFDTLTEFCQGPCWEAQSTVATYRFVSAVNELLLRGSELLVADTTLLLYRELKGAVVVTLLSLLEGRYDRVIHHRLVQELNFDAVKDNVVDVFKYFEARYHGEYDGNERCASDGYLTMGFNLHILMQQLIAYQPSLADALVPRKKQLRRDSPAEALYRRAFQFFHHRCARVEIVWPRRDGPSTAHDLLPVYFPIHPICLCVTDATRRQLLLDVPRDANRLPAFFRKAHVVMHEMQHQCSLRQHHLQAVLSKHTSALKMLAFVWALLLNATLLTNARRVELWYPMGCVHALLCSLLLFMHWTNAVPLLLERRPPACRPTADTPVGYDADEKETLQDVEALVRRLGRETHRPPLSRAQALIVLATNGRLLYRIALVVAAVAGLMVEPFYFAFHLVDFLNRSQELRDVVRAIVYPGKTLLHIVVFYLMVVYIFAAVAYTYFPTDFKVDASTNGCETPWQCFLTSLDQGLKNNGGLGGYLPSHRRDTDSLGYLRLVFDLGYNVVLIIVLINISFGVIIDTFASLRTAHKEQLDDIHDRCFVCAIDAYTFNRMTKRGFEYHTHAEHNVWHYIYLFVHVTKKAYTEYNGVELYLALRMARFDVSFFPNHRALTLEKLERAAAGDDATASDTSAYVENQLARLLEAHTQLLAKHAATERRLEELATTTTARCHERTFFCDE